LECSLDGGAREQCTERLGSYPPDNIAYTDLGIGNHTFTAYLFDQEGSAAGEAAYTWAVVDSLNGFDTGYPSLSLNPTNFDGYLFDEEGSAAGEATYPWAVVESLNGSDTGYPSLGLNPTNFDGNPEYHLTTWQSLQFPTLQFSIDDSNLATEGNERCLWMRTRCYMDETEFSCNATGDYTRQESQELSVYDGSFDVTVSPPVVAEEGLHTLTVEAHTSDGRVGVYNLDWVYDATGPMGALSAIETPDGENAILVSFTLDFDEPCFSRGVPLNASNAENLDIISAFNVFPDQESPTLEGLSPLTEAIVTGPARRLLQTESPTMATAPTADKCAGSSYCRYGVRFFPVLDMTPSR
jgi:hypothetical protein